MKRGYGYVPDKWDDRDKLFVAHEHIDVSKLPDEVDLAPHMPGPVYDQAALGSCTGNSIAKLVQFVRAKQGLPDFTPSRLFIYYGERELEGTVTEDAGAEIRDGMKAIATCGVCDEDIWPYVVERFRVKPYTAAYEDAAKHKSVTYMRVKQAQVQSEGCLAAGYPTSFGFMVYDPFESE